MKYLIIIFALLSFNAQATIEASSLSFAQKEWFKCKMYIEEVAAEQIALDPTLIENMTEEQVAATIRKAVRQYCGLYPEPLGA